MKILVADDDRVHLHFVSSRLKARGFDIVTAFDAMQAWMVVMPTPPDAVDLDISMPAGTGIEFLKRRRMSIRTSHIPVIVVSGSVGPSAGNAVRAAGADEFLPKPVDCDRLHPGLRRLLGSSLDRSFRCARVSEDPDLVRRS